MKIVHRYIIYEYLHWFSLCFIGFSVLSIGYFLFSMNDFFVGMRIPFSLVLKLVRQRFPMLMIDIVPTSVIFGIFLSIGRLMRDREFDVLRTSGLSFFNLIRPLLVTTIIIATGVFVWYDTVIPASNRSFQNEMRKLQFQDVLPMITENIFIKGPNNRYFYVRRFNGQSRLMEGIMIFEAQSWGYPRIITADTGRISGNNWLLLHGIIHELDQDGWVRYEVKFKRLTVNSGNDLTGFFGKQELIEEMTRAQLRNKMRILAKSGFPIAAYAVEYYNKTAIPYASFILALIAIPFTCLLSKKGWVWGFILSFLVILSYFFAQVFFRNLGQNTVVAPIVAAWGPNLIFFTLGVGLLCRVKR